jgi:hypothetical protein
MQGAMVNQPMPDYLYPTDNYEDAILAVVWPPLHWAACKDLPSTVVRLVNLGANIDAIDATATRCLFFCEQ